MSEKSWYFESVSETKLNEVRVIQTKSVIQTEPYKKGC